MDSLQRSFIPCVITKDPHFLSLRVTMIEFSEASQGASGIIPRAQEIAMKESLTAFCFP